MPILNVKVSAPKSRETSAAIAGILLELTSRILGKDPALTAIAIDYIDPDDWIVGGVPLSVQHKTSIYFDIKITDETNTKGEKARYIAEAFAAFEQLFGDLHQESYIHVQDVRAAAYGYGGRTQEFRYHAPAAQVRPDSCQRS
ncbi:MAG: 4-oxalocrotonate tautomerase family protein [Pseudomonadota bacterium]